MQRSAWLVSIVAADPVLFAQNIGFYQVGDHQLCALARHGLGVVARRRFGHLIGFSQVLSGCARKGARNPLIYLNLPQVAGWAPVPS
jgi:hypothetical protein